VVNQSKLENELKKKQEEYLKKTRSLNKRIAELEREIKGLNEKIKTAEEILGVKLGKDELKGALGGFPSLPELQGQVSKYIEDIGENHEIEENKNELAELVEKLEKNMSDIGEEHDKREELIKEIGE